MLKEGSDSFTTIQEGSKLKKPGPDTSLCLPVCATKIDSALSGNPTDSTKFAQKNCKPDFCHLSRNPISRDLNKD